MNITFTSIYLYFPTFMYVTAIPAYWRLMGMMSYMHFQSMGLLPMCTTLLWGMNIHGGPYILSDCRTDTINDVIWENPVTLVNTVLLDLPEFSKFWVPSTHSWIEAMDDSIVSLVASAYDIYQALNLPICTPFVSYTHAILSTSLQVISSLY